MLKSSFSILDRFRPRLGWWLAGITLAIALANGALALLAWPFFDHALSERATLPLAMLGAAFVGLSLAPAVLDSCRRDLARECAELFTPRALWRHLPATERRGGLPDADLFERAEALGDYLRSNSFFVALDRPYALLFAIGAAALDIRIGVLAFIVAVAVLLLPAGRVRPGHSAISAEIRRADNLYDDFEALGLMPGLLARWRAQAVAKAAFPSHLLRAAISFAVGAGIAVFLWRTTNANTVLPLTGRMAAALALTWFTIYRSFLAAWARDAIATGRHAAGGLAALNTRPADAEVPTTQDATQSATQNALAAKAGTLIFDSVSLDGADGVRLLDDINLVLEPGRIIVVIGPTGAGKSLLARLAAGALHASHGAATLAGQPLDTLETSSLRAAIGYQSQRLLLTPGTIADNIARMAEPQADKLAEATRLAGADGAIGRAPQGLETVLDEEGAPLSSGEAQCVALARALYGAPGLVVLDTPDAGSDPDGEERLADALHRCRAAGIGVLVISQSQRLAMMADEIILLEAGRITGRYQAPEEIEAEAGIETDEPAIAGNDEPAPVLPDPPPDPEPQSRYFLEMNALVEGVARLAAIQRAAVDELRFLSPTLSLPEEVIPEPAKAGPEEAEPVKDEPAEAGPVEAGPVEAEPVKDEPVDEAPRIAAAARYTPIEPPLPLTGPQRLYAAVAPPPRQKRLSRIRVEDSSGNPDQSGTTDSRKVV